MSNLPCDVEPTFDPSAECAPAGGGKPFDTARVGHPCSYYLTLKPRSLSRVITDISRYRDLPEWCWDLLRPKCEVVSLAERRRK